MKLPALIVILFTGILVLLSVVGDRPARLSASAVQTEGGPVALRPITDNPQITAHAFLVKIIGEKTPILKQREWKRLAPASLSKLLTAVVAKEYMPSNALVIFTPAAKTVEEADEKISSVRVGEKFSRDDALKLLLISSANDAAVALEEWFGGREVFLGLANEELKLLGLKDSQFKNSSGLDEEGHFMSAQDLARLAEYIWHYHPELWEITRNSEAVITSESGHAYEISSTNKLLPEFPGIRGGKTGFTDNAKESLILLYPVQPDRIAVVVILGSNNRFADARNIIKWLENGFRNQ